jgi:hypothetical protein
LGESGARQVVAVSKHRGVDESKSEETAETIAKMRERRKREADPDALTGCPRVSAGCVTASRHLGAPAASGFPYHEPGLPKGPADTALAAALL